MALTAPFSLRQLHYFVTAARTGQISAAASQAHISQSAMTIAIAELERLLGAPLFERSHTGVTLTYDGHSFLQQAEAVLEAANEAARFPFHRRTDVSGRLELAASYTVLGYFLLPVVAKFRKLFPLVEVVPVELTRPQIERGLLSGRIELAVALLSNLAERDRLQTVTLTRSRRQLWVANNHPLADAPGPVRLSQITQYPYIFPKIDEGDRNASKYWREAGLQPKSTLKTTSMEALREMVALGLGVTILSDMVFRPWSLDGRRIRTVAVDHPLPAMEIGLAWRPGQPLSPAAEVFKEFLTMTGVGIDSQPSAEGGTASLAGVTSR
jgi:DNA-binding transcriptional LysR family regulator